MFRKLFSVIIFTLILSLWSIGQTTPVWIKEVWKTTGETITITFEYPDSIRIKEFRLLRSTETGSPTIVATGGPGIRKFSVTMPSSTTVRYYYRVRPVAYTASGGNNVGPACEELIVNRR